MSKYTIEKAKSDMLFVMQWGHRNVQHYSPKASGVATDKMGGFPCLV